MQQMARELKLIATHKFVSQGRSLRGNVLGRTLSYFALPLAHCELGSYNAEKYVALNVAAWL